MVTTQNDMDAESTQAKIDVDNPKMLYSAELEMLSGPNLDKWSDALKDACTITDALWLLEAEGTAPPHLADTNKAKLQASVR